MRILLCWLKTARLFRGLIEHGNDTLRISFPLWDCTQRLLSAKTDAEKLLTSSSGMGIRAIIIFAPSCVLAIANFASLLFPLFWLSDATVSTLSTSSINTLLLIISEGGGLGAAALIMRCSIRWHLILPKHFRFFSTFQPNFKN